MPAPSRTETLTLEFPLQLADRLLTEVTMRRPIMKDLRKYSAKDLDKLDTELRHFSDLCNLRVEEMEQMDSADYARLQDLYVRFRTPAERRADQGDRVGIVPHDPVEPD
jgi:phosphatidylserine decarboxylase